MNFFTDKIINFAPMNYNTHTLSNGLRIIHLPSTSSVVYCGFTVDCGTRDELPMEHGMAHFVEHATFKGTQKRSAVQIINSVESLGADLNAFTNKEDTTYHVAVLKESADRAIDVLADMVLHSVFPQHEIDKEKDVVGDEIESYNDTPSDLIFDDFENIVFKDHPLGHNILGETEHLRTFTTEGLQAFAHRYYTPDNMVFFIYGDVSFRHIVSLLEKKTAGFPDATPRFFRQEETEPKTEWTHSVGRHVSMKKDTHQAHVMIGCRMEEFDRQRHSVLFLLNNILGGSGMNARLNMSLREKHALVYNVESSFTAYKGAYLWSVYYACDHADRAKCRRLVRHELDRLMNKPLSDRALAVAKKQLKGQIGVAADAADSFAIAFGKTFLHFNREKHLSRQFSMIDAVTAEDIQKLAQEMFVEDNLTELVYE